MRNSLTIAAILFMFNSIVAQTNADTGISRKNSIAINVNGILTELLNNVYYTPNILTYRRQFGRNALRVAISGRIDESKGLENDTNSVEFLNKRFTFKAGWEVAAINYKKWHMYIGLDGVITGEDRYFSRETSTSSYTSDGRSFIGYGISPVFGLIYCLNPMIGFGAETSLDVLYENVSSRTTFTYSNGDIETQSYENHEFVTEYNSPLGLMLRISF